MFCKNCGAEIPDGSAFCGNCGMKASAEPVQQEPVNQYASPDPQAYRAEPTSVDAPCACVESKPEPQPQYVQPEPQPQYTQPQYAQPEPPKNKIFEVLSFFCAVTTSPTLPALFA